MLVRVWVFVAHIVDCTKPIIVDKTNAVVVFTVGAVRFIGIGNCQSYNKREHNVEVDHLSSGREAADDNGEVVDEFAGTSLSLYRD